LINDKVHQEGLVPEPVLLAKLLQALAPEAEPEPIKPEKKQAPKQKGRKRTKSRKPAAK